MNLIYLGGVQLNGNINILGRDSSHAVAQSVKRTLGGELKIFFAKLNKGMPLTLQATEEQGWLSAAVVAQVMAMANTAGGTYQLLVNGVSTSVVFRHNEPPAFEAAPLVYRNNQQADDPHTCTIKLLTV